MKHSRFLRALSAAILTFYGAPLAAQAEPAPAVTNNAEIGDTAKNVARLIEVWGFIKYHHPDARSGKLAMDAEFFELYPLIRVASSREAADNILAEWLETIGNGPPCSPCAENEPASLDLIAIESPTPAWLAAMPHLLAEPLGAIYANRRNQSATFNIEQGSGVGNPIFLNQPDYSNTSRLLDGDLRMLTLARQWNALRYWFPYRDVMDRDVSAILVGAVSQFLASSTQTDHHRAMLRLAAKSDDSHVDIYQHEASISPAGDCVMPYSWRMIEGSLVVDGAAGPADPVLLRGDRVLAIDGVPISRLKAQYGEYIAASNSAWFDRKIAARLARGACAERTVEIEREGDRRRVTVSWLPPSEAKINLYRSHDRQGDIIQTLNNGATYVRFPLLKKENLPELLNTANEGSGLILDMRGYVKDFLVFELGGMLVDQPTEFVRFSFGDVATPGQFVFGNALSVSPDEDGRRINVPVVALVDEATISSPEYHAMAFRAAGVQIIGSTTAGADGNVSRMPLPDGADMNFTGIGVFYPDKSPTQRIGIVPDIEVRPTIAGIADGRDEVLERALEYLRSHGDG